MIRSHITYSISLLAVLLLVTGCAAAGAVSGAAEAGNGTTSSVSSFADENITGWESIPEGDTSGQVPDVSIPDTAEAGASDNSTEDSDTEADTDRTDQDSAESETTIDPDAESAGTDPAENVTSAYAGIDGTMTGSEEMTALMTDFMTSRGLNSSNYAVAYKNLATGEVFYYNELKQWDACSTYKFPLNLLYYDMEAAGEITEDTVIPGTNTPLSECHHQSLQYSNNELSEAMVNNLGAYDVMKQNMRKYFTLTDAEIDNSYYHHNYFCARMMMECFEYLYNHQSEYPDALAYLEAAQPGEYFRTYITDCTIAQKYGLRDGYNHDAGIIFGNVPFVLSVYTYNAGGNELIASTAQMFYNYTESE